MGEIFYKNTFVFTFLCLIFCETNADPPVAKIKFSNRVSAQNQPSLATKLHVDRLEILTQERNEILSKLNKLESSADTKVLSRIQGDLQAIDREIALVSREQSYPITNTSTPGVGAKPMATAQAVNQESQPKDSESVTYEGWDIFKNFGRKGNQP